MKKIAAQLIVLIFGSGCQVLQKEPVRVFPIRYLGENKLAGNGPVHELVSLRTRPTAVARFLLVRPERPKAAVVLFAGAQGDIKLRFTESTLTIGSRNILIRNRDQLVARGFAVAAVDVPSDLDSLDNQRRSDVHQTDIEAVIDYLKTTLGTPVWLAGMSRGTESAASVAARSGSRISGVALLSSITKPSAKGSSLLQMDLHSIRSPVIIAAHENDECPISPPENAHRVANRLTSATAVAVRTYEGGREAIDGKCEPYSPHGFYGIENQVIDDIAEFIDQHLPSIKP